MRTFLLLIIVLLISSCAGSGKNVVLLQQELKSNQTNVFVKRETGFAGSAALIKVGLNGATIGEIGEKERISTISKIGDNIISGSFTGLASIGAKDGFKKFKISENQKMFFIIKQDLGLFDTKLKIYEINQQEFFN
tara:strand:- start:250 stop:657 length:408 start_codon:yes stop_codon:yes gene_type:complete